VIHRLDVVGALNGYRRRCCDSLPHIQDPFYSLGAILFAGLLTASVFARTAAADLTAAAPSAAVDPAPAFTARGAPAINAISAAAHAAPAPAAPSAIATAIAPIITAATPAV
jgi:hypothetical protein